MNRKLQAVLEKMPETGFAFDEATHTYGLDRKPLTGVTTILQVIAKPMLIGWAANETGRYIRENCKRGEFDYLVTEDDLLLACKAHAKRKKDAGDIGTKAHREVERIVKDAIANYNGYIGTCVLDPEVSNMVINFVGWAKQNNVKFLESEKKLFSKEHWYAGTCDLVFEMGGKRYIGDIKTSSGIYNEHFFQMAAYEICLEEMGVEKVDGYLVINLRKDGTMDLKVTENREINKQGFLHALGLYKTINSIE
jgi:hypothetical protein